MSDKQGSPHAESGWKSLLAVVAVSVSAMVVLGGFLWSEMSELTGMEGIDQVSGELADTGPPPPPDLDMPTMPLSPAEEYRRAFAELPDYMQEQMAAAWARKELPMVPENDSVEAMREFLLRPGMLAGDVEPWLPVVRMLAANNDPEAQWLLAELLRLQLAPEEDPDEMVSLYEVAAAAGDPRAMRQIGRYLQEGTVYEQDMLAALDWFEQAAAAGSSDALLDIGLLYANGAIDGEVSPELAHEYYSMAAEAGNALGLVYQAIDYLGEHEHVSPDLPLAQALLEDAARMGSGQAHFLLANLYLQGLISIEDVHPKRISAHMHLAAELGFDLARYLRSKSLVAVPDQNAQDLAKSELIDLTASRYHPAGKTLGELMHTEAAQTSNAESMAMALDLTQWSALSGSFDSMVQMARWGFDESLSADLRPDPEYWIQQLLDRGHIGGALLDHYVQQGMTTQQALEEVLGMSQLDRYLLDQNLRIDELEETASIGDPDNQEPIPPRMLSSVQPKYPPSLHALGIEGKVTVEFVVRTDGSVSNVAVVDSTHPAFAAAAIESVSQWEFAPAQKPPGTPVNLLVRIQIPFRTRR